MDCEHCGERIDLDPEGTWLTGDTWPRIGSAYCASSPDHRHHPGPITEATILGASIDAEGAPGTSVEQLCTPLTLTVDESRLLYDVLDFAIRTAEAFGDLGPPPAHRSMLNSLRTAVAESLPPGVEVTP